MSVMLRPSRLPPPPRLHAWQHDLIDVEKAVLLQPDVDERRLEPGEDVVDLSLVDVAHDRAGSATLQVQLGHVVAVSGACPLASPARGRRTLLTRSRGSGCF